MSKKFVMIEFILPFILGGVLIAIGAKFEEKYGVDIQEAFTVGGAEVKLLFIVLCGALIIIGLGIWHLNWIIIRRVYPMFVNTINELHRSFIDISLVIISSVACWYSMMDSKMDMIPKTLFVFIVPIAVSVVVIDFYKTCQTYHREFDVALTAKNEKFKKRT